MKTKITFLSLFLSVVWQVLLAQAPLVYSVENTGSGCARPPLPSISQLPVIQPLPDPFMWANGSGRSTSFSDWECRRNEIKAQIENYEIGVKPPKPDSITASYASTSSTAGVLTVVVTRNGQTLTLTCAVALPSVNGPWPAVIGMNSPSGSVPSTVFTGRNIARITFSHNNVTTYGSPSLNDPYYKLYPEYNLVNSGQYSAWAWGVSRIIDGLELVQSSLPIDLRHIGVTGCSYAGKMALFAGAFDERIALTIAQESGGGGAPSWRASHNLEPNGTVEKIDNTDYTWFRDSMMQFAGDNVYKLPEDHHELMAMIAPRALLATGNTDFTWLSNQSNYVSSRATKEIYRTLGISDRFGFYIDGGHNHCAVPTSQVPAMQAFVDKFLVGDNTVNTDTVTVNPFPNLNYQRWYQWWGTGNPVLPPPPGRRVWMEAECARVGASWTTMLDTAASNGKYVAVKSGLSSTATPPTGDSSYLVLPFTVDTAATYNLFSRLYFPPGEDYSYWMKVDNGAYTTISSVLLANGGFENGLTGWTTLNSNGATITADNTAADAHSGSSCMKVVNPTAQTGNQWKVQVTSTAFPTTIGKQYTITYWVRAASAGGSIRLSTGPTNAQYQADQTIGTAWQQVSWSITAALSSTTFLFDMGQVANTYYIDDAVVKDASGGGGSWQWIKLRDTVLNVGSHTVSIGYRSGNAKMDKVLVTTFSDNITDKGDAATNCAPVTPPSLVYNAENTGGSCGAPPLPTIDNLPVIQPLPDPFMWANGSGRSTSFSDWECRRNEIKAQIENYEIGTKPARPDSITASYVTGPAAGPDTLKVYVTKNGKMLTLTSQVYRPTGSGPFPAVIGMNSPSGSIPDTVFKSRNIARITFNHNQVTTYYNPQLTDPYYQLYPDQNTVNAGQYSAWSWGVSRIIDGLELVQSSLPVDLNHIGVTGCSYAGKMALFAGAFDERIALTIAQESGGGGAPAWRVSQNIEPNGSVEKMDNTDYNWFRDSMHLFAGDNVYKLPEDHHELMAMVAPRALLVTGNTDFTWLSNKAAYVSARATKEVYNTFGIGDRFGFYIDGGHNHCAVPTAQVPTIQAFVDKFLGGMTNINTDTVAVNPFPSLDYYRWYQWWGTGNPVLPPAPAEPLGKTVWMEAECATVGSLWNVMTDTAASNGKYVTIRPGLNSTAGAPSGDSSAVVFTFNIDSAAVYNIRARVNCPTADDDSYWVKVDNGAFTSYNGLNGVGWQWVLLGSPNLTIGTHTLTIAYREDGAALDKVLLITSAGTSITDKGDAASNCSALPVTLVKFDGSLVGSKVALKWNTVNEINIQSYEVEKSADGTTFKKIASVSAKNSSGENQYLAYDADVTADVQYYRLRIVSKDGDVKYSATVTIMLNGNAVLTLLPNPVKDNLFISHSRAATDASISIITANGSKVLKVKVVAGSIQSTINTSGLAEGTYFLQFMNNDKIETRRFIKM